MKSPRLKFNNDYRIIPNRRAVRECKSLGARLLHAHQANNKEATFRPIKDAIFAIFPILPKFNGHQYEV